ncbi:MAG: FAD-dependent oxidoreductase [Eubacteriales bacterium]
MNCVLPLSVREGKHYDIAVFGAGSAGFCAAVQSARSGKRVALVEKYAMPGGVLTVLGNNSIDQFNNPFREADKMVITGIGWEFCRRLSAMGYAHIPDMDAPYRSHAQYGVKVNPVAAAALMADMLLEAGVELYLDQQLCSVLTSRDEEGARVDGAILSTKSGLLRLSANIYIDCTGDGDLCAMSGADYVVGDGMGREQPGTLRFYPSATRPTQDGSYLRLLRSRGDNCNHVTDFHASVSDKKTQGELRGLRMMLEYMNRLKDANAPVEITATAPATAPRESRHIMCDTVMDCEGYVAGTVFDDSVCYSFWFVDIHNDEGDATISYIKTGKTPTIRYSAMLPKGLKNVLVAGRPVGADRECSSALRVKASCMAMGQAAGAAASLSLDMDCTLRDIQMERLKRVLADSGAIVPGLTPFADFKSVL